MKKRLITCLSVIICMVFLVNTRVFATEDDTENENKYTGIEDWLMPSPILIDRDIEEVASEDACDSSSTTSVHAGYDLSDHYIYNCLSDGQKSIYLRVYNDAMNKRFNNLDYDPEVGKYLVSAVDISGFSMTIDDAVNAFRALEYDAPEVFYLDGSLYYSSNDNRLATGLWIYAADEFSSPEARISVQNDIDAVIYETVQRTSMIVEPDLKVLEIIKILNEKLYYSLIAGDPEISKWSASIASLSCGRAICAGYSADYAFLSRKIGIPTCEVLGVAYGEGFHAWNHSYINGNYYSIDPTWLDSDYDYDIQRCSWFLTGSNSFYGDGSHLALGMGAHENGWFGFYYPEVPSYNYYDLYPLPEKHNVTFYAYGAEFPGKVADMISFSVEVGSDSLSDISAFIPNKDGYIFKGFHDTWMTPVYDENGRTIDTCFFTKGVFVYHNELSLFATFEKENENEETEISEPEPTPETHVIILRADGCNFIKYGKKDTCWIENVVVGDSKYSNISDYIPERDGYTFEGFFTSCNSMIYNSDGTAVESDIWVNGKFAAHENIVLFARMIVSAATPTPTPTPEPKDTMSPWINSVGFENVTSEGFSVTVCASDNEGISSADFCVWTEADGTDKIYRTFDDPSNYSSEGSIYTYEVHTFEHNNASGVYHIKITITDLSGNTYISEETLNVPVKESEQISDTYIVMVVKEKADITTLIPANIYGPFTYKSSNKKILSVNKKGIAKAKQSGNVTVYVYRKGDKYNIITTINIEIIKPVVSTITLTQPGDYIELTNSLLRVPEEKNICWTVIKGKRETGIITENRFVAGDKNGTVKIQARIGNGTFAAIYNIKVKLLR